MAAELPTYSYYSSTYGGTASSDVFESSLGHAAVRVKRLIWPNEPDDSNTSAYQDAVCAAVDVDASYGSSSGIGERSSSLGIGSFSASTGSSSGETAYDADMDSAIAARLVGSGLLYMGLS